MGTAAQTTESPAGTAPPQGQTAPPSGPVSYTRESLETTPILELIADEGLKKDPSLASFKGVEGLARSYSATKKLVGGDASQFLKIPTEATTPDELSRFYNTLGRPEVADGYVVPEGVTANQEKLQITNEVVSEFRGVAHQLGLSNKQFQAVLDWYGGPEGFAAKNLEAVAGEFESSIAQSTQKLQTEWGERFDLNMELAKSAMRVVGKQDETIHDLLETPFLIGKGRLGDDPRMIRLFQRIGAGLREDEMKDGRAGTSASFESKLDPASAQAEINTLRADPEFRAKWLDDKNPAHKDAVAKLARLYEQLHPA